jgi:hypothetical protein
MPIKAAKVSILNSARIEIVLRYEGGAVNLKVLFSSQAAMKHALPVTQASSLQSKLLASVSEGCAGIASAVWRVELLESRGIEFVIRQ